MKKSLIVILTALLFSCNRKPEAAKGSFGYDLQFIRQHDSNAVLLGEGNSQIIVSPKYQAKVITSTADGLTGKSFGWVNHQAYDTLVPHLNAYGGENRIWIGPEGGPFTIFFKPSEPLTFENWQTPSAFDSEAWTLESKTTQTAQLSKRMSFVNYKGNQLDMSVRREISILDQIAIKAALHLNDLPNVKAVAYETENTLQNTGNTAWTKSTGAPCLWLLDMLPTGPQTTVITKGTAPANTAYYGDLPTDRLSYQNGLVFFKADGQQRCKFGLGPVKASNILASYDSLHHILTITLYDVSNTEPYLNELWKTNVDPYAGDVIQSYNDGPLTDGSRIGESGFYELESASPALFLKPGQSATHHHTVFHFTGPENQLNPITQQILGISISDIKKVFPHS